ncbi:MAG: hypothetical protein FJ211_07550 [Ignavibacteria bacterium]|nr:hypothetical protein [Ignavibacteria bacterium]
MVHRALESEHMGSRVLSLFFVGAIMSTVISAQEPEWLFKNHKYHRMKTGSSMISVDSTFYGFV